MLMINAFKNNKDEIEIAFSIKKNNEQLHYHLTEKQYRELIADTDLHIKNLHTYKHLR